MTLFDQLVALFRHAGWPIEQVPGENIVSVTYRSGDDRWVFVAAANDDIRTITLFARAPEPCPPERMDDMLEFINRVNFALSLGAWVVDLADGEIRFRFGVDMVDRDLTGTELTAVVNYVNASMTAALPALRSLVADTVSPTAAVEMVFS